MNHDKPFKCNSLKVVHVWPIQSGSILETIETS